MTTTARASKTECVIALDEDDSDGDEEVCETSRTSSEDIQRTVTETMARVLNIIETLPLIVEVDERPAGETSDTMPSIGVDVIQSQTSEPKTDRDKALPLIQEIDCSDDENDIQEIVDKKDEDQEIETEIKRMRLQFSGDRQVCPVEEEDDIQEVADKGDECRMICEPPVRPVVEDDDDIREVVDEGNKRPQIRPQLIGGQLVRPVDDDEEDIENMECNIMYAHEQASDDDMEAEDCMIIESMPYVIDKTPEPQHIEPTNEESDNEIEIIEPMAAAQEPTNVIDLSDDEEECVIIDDTFSSKFNKIPKREGQRKRSLSPVYTSESFIPLSQPSTSSYRPISSRLSSQGSSSSAYRQFQTERRSDPINSSFHSHHNSFSSPSSTTSVFQTSNNQTFVETTHVTRRVSSSYIQPINTSIRESVGNSSHNSLNISGSQQLFNTSHSSSSNVTEEVEEDSIPFLYGDPKPSTSSDVVGSSNVQDVDLIANCVQLDRRIVQNVLDLFEDQCTVPFIVRYRQSVISGIDADRVRKISSIYGELKNAKERAKDVEQTLRKQDRLNPKLLAALNRCKNVFEVEHLYRLCGNESGNSEKYRNLGLSDSAMSVLEGKRLDPNHFVNRFAFCLDTPEAVKEGWSSIISDIISKDCDVLEFLIRTTKEHIPVLQTFFVKERADELARESNAKNCDIYDKYVRFHEMAKPVDRINAHTYMAIERGESLGLLKIFVQFKPTVLNQLIDFCLQKWNRCISHILVNCVRMAFNTALRPSLIEYIRWELRHSAHMTALEVFRNNVKYLLLEPPLRGEFVIGVDPGHGSGYKVALVSPWMVPLNCFVLHLDPNRYESSAVKLRTLMEENNCSIIALGNGTGCRRFEDMLQERMQSGFFGKINVKYKIINESGVSWYSVSEEARKDLPHHNPQMIGAICIARRLMDPLSELVKVDPKRLQVGMYMRDIDEDAIRRTFHEVAVECVSFCGVDVNTASLEVLRFVHIVWTDCDPLILSKVAGLEHHLAQLIIERRERDGPIQSRSQLRTIGGISWKQFEQCAGFIKVMPLTRREPLPRPKNVDGPDKRTASSTDDYDPLDSTNIHPESYSCATTYIKLIGASKDEIGKLSMRNKIARSYESLKMSLPEMAQYCNTHPSNMKLIIEGLSNSIDFDYRTNFAQIYIPDIQRFDELTVGTQLRGRVVNVTPMGAFVDCGIVGGINAYIKARECDKHAIVPNDQVLVTIETINRVQQRFSALIVKVFKTNVKFG